VRSAIKPKEVEKARTDGSISTEDSIKFPSTERIPEPPSGYRVMFLDFLLRGLSLPAHEFLRGLLFFLRCAASPAHTKLHSPHCLLRDSLRVILGH
jgi:hypothetical protein